MIAGLDSQFWQALLIGVLVVTATYLGLRRIAGPATRRAQGLFLFALGVLTTLWLVENPAFLDAYAGRIVAAGVAVVLALLYLARRSL